MINFPEFDFLINIVQRVQTSLFENVKAIIMKLRAGSTGYFIIVRKLFRDQSVVQTRNERRQNEMKTRSDDYVCEG